MSIINKLGVCGGICALFQEAFLNMIEINLFFNAITTRLPFSQGVWRHNEPPEKAQRPAGIRWERLENTREIHAEVKGRPRRGCAKLREAPVSLRELRARPEIVQEEPM